MQLVQGKYTIAKESHENPIHVQVIRGPFTRNIGALIPDVAEEVALAMDNAVPKTGDGVICSFVSLRLPEASPAFCRRMGQRRCPPDNVPRGLPREQPSIHRSSTVYVLCLLLR